MIRVGSKEFDKLSTVGKMSLLLQRGYTQAAFAYKGNAEKFAAALKRKGYKVSGWRSSGPTVENVNTGKKAYYVIGERKRK